MASFYPKPDKGLYFDDFNPGPYTLFGHNLFAKRWWDCKRLLSVNVKDLESTRIEPEEFRTFVIGEGISRVGPGVIESFPNLLDLITGADLKKIGGTPALEELLQRNNVILRGSFNSPAEALAKKLGLRFIHKNIFLSSHRDEEHGQSTSLTLCFQLDEPPFFWRDDKTLGISAGNTGGGTVRTDLDEDFYVGYDAGKFAEDFVGAYHTENVRTNKELAGFLAEANRRLKKA